MPTEWDLMKGEVRKKATELAKADLATMMGNPNPPSENHQALILERLVHKHMYEIGEYLLAFKGYGPEARRIRKLLNIK